MLDNGVCRYPLLADPTRNEVVTPVLQPHACPTHVATLSACFMPPPNGKSLLSRPQMRQPSRYPETRATLLCRAGVSHREPRCGPRNPVASRKAAESRSGMLGSVLRWAWRRGPWRYRMVRILPHLLERMVGKSIEALSRQHQASTKPIASKCH